MGWQLVGMMRRTQKLINDFVNTKGSATVHSNGSVSVDAGKLFSSEKVQQDMREIDNLYYNTLYRSFHGKRYNIYEATFYER